MPNYEYLCNQCGYNFEIHQSIKSEPLKICEVCQQEGLERVIHSVTCCIKGEAKTLGVFAERKMQSMSNAEKSEFYEKQNTQKVAAKQAAREEIAKKIPSNGTLVENVNKSGEKVDLSLTKLTPQQTEKYVLTGEK